MEITFWNRKHACFMIPPHHVVHHHRNVLYISQKTHAAGAPVTSWCQLRVQRGSVRLDGPEGASVMCV